MDQTRAIVRARVEATLRRRVRRAVHRFVTPLHVEAHHVHGEPIPVEAARAAVYEPFSVGGAWGAAWETTWFRMTGTIPAECADHEVVARIGLGYHAMPGFGAEGLVWHGERPLQGINPQHSTVRVAAKAEGGEQVELLVEAAANPPPMVRSDPAATLLPDFGGTPLFRLDRAELAAVDAEVQALFYDLTVLLDLYDNLPGHDRRAAEVLRALNAACNVLDDDDIHATAVAARHELTEVLSRPAAASAHRVSAAGNAHIDTAWLWPLRETVRKCARTFSTAVELMEDYPDYRFACSQAQQLAWMKDRYPALWDRIVERVDAGQFEPVGCMWVEPDCNVPSGESLVRQIVHGKRFFQDELGVDVDEVWLPDVFGYSAALPQIMRLAGVNRFLTQKLSWNQWNRMPHNSFWWEGIDGSRVLAHFPPADTYNGTMVLSELNHAVRTFADHGVASGSLYLFGFGDGGGGPTADMLERARRLHNLEGAPRVELERVEDFWERTEAEGGDLAVWSGELYFELHRGTYTTHAEVKRGNRELELLLREAELWSSLRPDPWAHYPAVELDAAWKELLTHQFHDILPGTSINWVYRDTAAAYDRVRAVATASLERAVGAIAATVDTSGCEQPVLLFNASPADRDEILVVDGIAFRAQVPALGYARYDLGTVGRFTSDWPKVSVGDHEVDNGILRVTWDEGGGLTSVVDLEADCEIVIPGQRVNELQLLEDRPNEWDAWDIDFFASEQVRALEAVDAIDVIERGPLRAAVRFTRTFGRSRIEQTMILRSGSRRIDFVTEVDWHEDHKLLKAAFPLDIHSGRATFEIQYGHVERPTHRNTSWDVARFEVCAHKWADLSEPGYGVAVLNDSKYGHDVLGNVLRLTLLRSPTSPDPEADRGHHRFTYSLFPHRGDLREGGVIDEAYLLNIPVRTVVLPPGRAGGAPPDWRPLSTDQPNVLVEVVKRAEAGDRLVIRLYEAWGRRGPVVVHLPPTVAHVARADLLEAETEPLTLDDGAVRLSVRPFEIITLVAATHP